MLEDFKRSLSIARRTTESSIFVCLFLVVWVFFNEKKYRKAILFSVFRNHQLGVCVVPPVTLELVSPRSCWIPLNAVLLE